MKIQNNRLKHSTICSALVVSVMILSATGTRNVLADNVMDTTDYFGQASKIFNTVQKISSEADSLQQQIVNLKVSGDANSPVISNRMAALQNQLNDDNKQIADGYMEIKYLEALNIKSYQVDAQTEKKLHDAENAIRAKYMANDSPNNPVQLVFTNFKYRDIVVMLDPNQVKSYELAAKGLDANTLQLAEPTKDIPVDIQYGKMQPLSCPSVNQTCTPLVGGISVSNIAVHTLNTLGYRAFQGSTAGFVIAGHTATESNTIVQPFNSNNVIGTVTIHGGTTCDCAFMAANQASVNQIFGRLGINISSDIPQSQQTVGSWAYKAGARTGTSLGQIVANDPTTGEVLLQIYVGGGDSGSPVYKYDSGTNTVSLYGMLYSASNPNPSVSYARYYSWDHIQGDIGITPSP